MNNNQYTIHEIAKKIIGKINSVGETYTDEVRFANLQVQCNLIVELLGDVFDESENKEHRAGSIEKSGKFAHKFLMELKEYLDDVLYDYEDEK